MTPDKVLGHLGLRMPQFKIAGDPEPLSGGYLNFVWRVNGDPEPVVVKFAPPYIASIPEIQLDPRRIVIEARCLEAFGAHGALSAAGNDAVRPPRLLDFDERSHILVMEDIGEPPGFGTWLQQKAHREHSAAQIGHDLGQFIGALHAGSYNNQSLAERFDNTAIQRTRLEVQYRAIRDLCVRAGLSDAEALGRTAAVLGELLQKPGLYVIMGDLWPPSILVAPGGLRIIDWELAHFGRPSQDVGHLVAHLWMHIHRAPTKSAAARAQATLHGFLVSYRWTLGRRFDEVFGAAGIRESAIHLGAEILVRAVGAFQNGYLYQGLSPNDPSVQEAAGIAAQHIRAPASVDTFADLAL